ncbi:hypothetical protein B0H11DRAFT_1939386 [Mycena galericulata]|nr:hypothetical protein B0H11DRAFT_1939386 [Mycena galericulata]
MPHKWMDTTYAGPIPHHAPRPTLPVRRICARIAQRQRAIAFHHGHNTPQRRITTPLPPAGSASRLQYHSARRRAYPPLRLANPNRGNDQARGAVHPHARRMHGPHPDSRLGPATSMDACCGAVAMPVAGDEACGGAAHPHARRAYGVHARLVQGGANAPRGRGCDAGRTAAPVAFMRSWCPCGCLRREWVHERRWAEMQCEAERRWMKETKERIWRAWSARDADNMDAQRRASTSARCNCGPALRSPAGVPERSAGAGFGARESEPIEGSEAETREVGVSDARMPVATAGTGLGSTTSGVSVRKGGLRCCSGYQRETPGLGLRTSGVRVREGREEAHHPLLRRGWAGAGLAAYASGNAEAGRGREKRHSLPCESVRRTGLDVSSPDSARKGPGGVHIRRPLQVRVRQRVRDN